MSDAPKIITSRYRAVYDFMATGLLPGFVPVRASLGKPKFMPDSEAWPFVKELAPAGLLGIEDRDDFSAAYRSRLDKIGTDRIERKFNEIAENYPGQQLAILCFEDVTVKWCHRSMFAEWWTEQTGQRVDEVNEGSLLPVSGWRWTGKMWRRTHSPARPPVKVSAARRAR